MKKIINLALSMLVALMAVVSLCGISAKAENRNYLYGNELSKETIDILSDGNIDVNDSTIIELTPADSGAGNAIIVTNTRGNVIEKNIVAVMDAEGNLPITDLQQLRGLGYNNQSISYTENSIHIIMYGHAYYYRYSDGTFTRYFRPMQASFSYVRKQGYSNANVTYLKLRYATVGTKYTYPGFVQQGSGLYTHIITVEKNSPLAGTIYSKSSPLTSGYVLYAPDDPSGMGTGMWITVYGTVDGVYFDYNFTL